MGDRWVADRSWMGDGLLADKFPGVGQLSIRLATITDAEAIRAIYNHEVLRTFATFDLVPRSLQDQQDWITARTGAMAAIVVIDEGNDEEGPTVVGFGSLSAYKDRAAYRTSVEDSVYVHQEHQSRGIGKMIVSELLSIGRRSGFHAVFARISAPGEASRRLHASCGFELVGVEREVGRKFNRWLDVIIMQVLLNG
ncbi:MAG: N-acetyltransferase family protein [Ilumatobacteraceae bacterium]